MSSAPPTPNWQAGLLHLPRPVSVGCSGARCTPFSMGT